MTCEEAFKILGPYLWEVEKREIFEYKTIYFFNIEERKKSHFSARGQKKDKKILLVISLIIKKNKMSYIVDSDFLSEVKRIC